MKEAALEKDSRVCRKKKEKKPNASLTWFSDKKDGIEI
jgi:hypothetical protein